MFGKLFGGDSNDSRSFTSLGGGADQSSFSLSRLWSMDRTQVTIFGCLFGAGAVFTVMSFVFFPLLVVAPHKFTLLFTLGSLCFMNSIAYINGYLKFGKHLLEPKKLPFSIGYLVSLFGCLYSTLMSGNYLLTLAMIAIQMSSLLVFLISYFPGGTTLLSAAKDAAVSSISGGNSSVLPF